MVAAVMVLTYFCKCAILLNEGGAYAVCTMYYTAVFLIYSKIFFRKEPDHEFTDMHYLRYC